VANKHLKRDAHHPGGLTNWWWYEEPRGMFVIHQQTDAQGNTMQPASVVIPWSALRAALRRKDKPSHDA